MLDRTQKRVGHGKEREVEDGRRGIQREEKWGKYQPTWTLCDRLFFLPLSGNVSQCAYMYICIYHSKSQLTS